MELEFRYLVPAGMLAVGVLAARFLGKVLSARIAMGIAGATDRVKMYLGMALVPQAGVAVGLMLLVEEDPALESIGDLFLAVGLTVVTINEIIGPVLTRYALKCSGESGRDRARLIDFIHEENIVTDFQAATKEEAIEKLTDLLIQTHHLRTDRDKLLESIIEREREGSTCFGEGLAMPHGLLAEGGQIVGVMALTDKGLHFDTPDGKPVHCMVLLATPPSERDRHLEVLAALARVIGSDWNVQQELFGSRTAAHAFEVLHAEASEELNPFLPE
jgi:mannitol/fructose-specific phosphotransferase system IIA component (Ntr-type)